MKTTLPPTHIVGPFNTHTYTMLKVGCIEQTKACDVCCSLLGEWYNRFRFGSGVWVPTSQKSSLKSHMNLTRRENAGVFPLMDLGQNHQSNTIHELSGSGDHLKTQNGFNFYKCIIMDTLCWPSSPSVSTYVEFSFFFPPNLPGHLWHVIHHSPYLDQVVV